MSSPIRDNDNSNSNNNNKTDQQILEEEMAEAVRRAHMCVQERKEEEEHVHREEERRRLEEEECLHKEEEEKERLRLEEEERLHKEAERLRRQRERDEEEERLRMEEDERRNREALESLCLEEAMGGVVDVGAEDVVMDGDDEVDDAGAEDVGEEDEGEEKKGVPAPKYKYVVDSCSSSWMTDMFLRPRTPPCVACANAGLECEYCPPLSFHKAEVWCCRQCRERSRRKCSLRGLGGPPGAKKDFPKWFAEWEARKG